MGSLGSAPARGRQAGGWDAHLGLVFILVATVWTFPYFARMQSAAELPRVILADEIVRAQTLALDARLDEFGSRFDIATTPSELGGHHYSNKAPGLSLAGVPVAAVVRGAGGDAMTLTFWLRLLIVTVPCLWFLVQLGPALRDMAASGNEAQGGDASDGAARLVLVAYALGSMALPYSKLFFAHALAAALLGGGYLVVRARTTPRALAWCGLLLGASVVVDYQCAFGAIVIATFALWRTRRVATIGWVSAGAAGPALMLGVYHYFCFGAPWRTGYHFAADPAHKQGFLGIVGPSAEGAWNTLLAPDNGLLFLSPWVLLAVVGAVSIARDRAAWTRWGADAVVASILVVGYLGLVIAMLPTFGRGGWSVGPRYIGCAMPFVALLSARGAAVLLRTRAASLVIASVVVSVVVYAVAANTFPHWPIGFNNPVWEVSVRALREHLAPHSLGSFLGLRPMAGVVPALIATALALLWSMRGLRAAGAGLALGVIWFAATSLAPRTAPVERERMWSYIRSVWEP